jgi:hypothetical protein
MAFVEKTVGTGGDYTTWAAAFAAVPSDISTGTGTDEIWRFSGFTEAFDEMDLVLSGVTTDATGYVWIRSQNSVRRGDGSGFNYTPNSGVSFEPTGTYGSGTRWLDVQVDYTIVEDVEFTLASVTSVWQHLGFIHRAGMMKVRGCMMSGTPNFTFGGRAFDAQLNSIPGLEFHHNLLNDPDGMFNFGCPMFQPNTGAGADMEIYNNVFYTTANAPSPIVRSWANENVSLKNNISFNGAGAAAFQFQELGGTITSDRNMSGDASADDNGDGTHYINEVLADIFVDPTNGDFHLKPGTNAVGNGVDLGTSPDEIEFDMDGYDRDAGGVAWDLGIDQEGFPFPPVAVPAAGELLFVGQPTAHSTAGPADYHTFDTALKDSEEFDLEGGLTYSFDIEV